MLKKNFALLFICCFMVPAYSWSMTQVKIAASLTMGSLMYVHVKKQQAQISEHLYRKGHLHLWSAPSTLGELCKAYPQVAVLIRYYQPYLQKPLSLEELNQLTPAQFAQKLMATQWTNFRKKSDFRNGLTHNVTHPAAMFAAFSPATQILIIQKNLELLSTPSTIGELVKTDPVASKILDDYQNCFQKYGVPPLSKHELHELTLAQFARRLLDHPAYTTFKKEVVLKQLWVLDESPTLLGLQVASVGLLVLNRLF